MGGGMVGCEGMAPPDLGAQLDSSTACMCEIVHQALPPCRLLRHLLLQPAPLRPGRGEATLGLLQRHLVGIAVASVALEVIFGRSQ